MSVPTCDARCLPSPRGACVLVALLTRCYRDALLSRCVAGFLLRCRYAPEGDRLGNSCASVISWIRRAVVPRRVAHRRRQALRRAATHEASTARFCARQQLAGCDRAARSSVLAAEAATSYEAVTRSVSVQRHRWAPQLADRSLSVRPHGYAGSQGTQRWWEWRVHTRPLWSDCAGAASPRRSRVDGERIVAR